MRILVNDIESEDGVANAACLEAAQCIEDLISDIEMLKQKILDLKNEQANPSN